VETSYGCSREDFFGGCEQRRGKARGPASVELARRVGGSESETRRTLSGTRLQYTWTPACGVSHRGGAKPRGWTETKQLVAAGRREWQHFWEWTQAGHVGGGALNEQAHERQVGCGESETTSRDAASGASRRSERSQDHEGRLEHFVRFAPRKANERGEDPEDPPVTGKVERVGG